MAALTSRRRRSRRAAAVLALGAVLAVSCLRDTQDPGAGRSARLALAPVFAAAAAVAVDFDQVRVTVVRGATADRVERPVVDTLVPFPATSDSIEVAIRVPLEAATEQFLVFIRLITAAGDTVFRNEPYPQSVIARAGAVSAVLEAILVYVGIGFDAIGVVITTPDTTLATGETLPLTAVALAADQSSIPGTPIAWSSLDPARVDVPDPAVGLAVAGAERGDARIVARLPTGPADTIIVTTRPPAGAIQIVSGEDQQAVVGAALPLPLRVRVTASDGLGVQASVRFRALSSLAAVADTLVVSDAAGFAETVATLGGTTGAQSFEAAVPGVAPVLFVATADPGAPARLAYLVEPSDVLVTQPITPAVEVAVQDSFGNTVVTATPTVSIRFNSNPTGALLGGAPGAVPVQGVASFGDLTVSLAGAGYTLLVAAAGLPALESQPFDVALPPPTPLVLFGGDSSAMSLGLFSADGDGKNRVRLTDLGSGGDVHARQSPDLRRVAFTYGPRGAVNELFVVARSADTIVRLVADTSTRRPRWSPDGVRLAFECGDGISPGQDVCVIPDVTGSIPSLTRLGDGAGKVFVTDFDAKNPDGPGSFAWDPLDGKNLFVVRDSTLQSADVASRLWRVTFDALGFAPVSPEVMDVGKGPLRIVGPLDITPDGSTVVFAAVDPGFVQALYAIRRDGASLRQVSGGPTDWAPVISPDGLRIAFLRDPVCPEYWLANVDGSGERRLSAEGQCDLDPEPLGHDWSPDGKSLVLVGRDALGNALVFRVPAGTIPATYATDRVLVGRGVDPGGFVVEGQPSWRP